MSYAIFAVLAGLLWWVLSTFNRGVALRNQQAEAWSGVDVQLKKRHDLVPPLVECVKAYSEHESRTLQEVAAKRGEAGVVEAMRGLLALAEAYPDLKAAENFRDLTSKLVLVEEDLQYARRYYNGSVRDFRNYAESFPSNIIARGFGFSPGEFFEVESVLEKQAPQVGL